MDEPLFCDQKHQPTEVDLAGALGRTKGLWDRVVSGSCAAHAGVTAEWKHYAGRNGWVLLLRAKKRNVLYLKPQAKQFLASFALGEKVVAAAERADLPAAIVEMIRTAPKYPEGRAVRITVKTSADAGVVDRVLALKLGF